MAEVEALAAVLLEARRSGRPRPVDASAAPRSAAEAYRVQQHVLDRVAFGQRPVAWKVSPPIRGAEPLASPVPPAGVLESPARIAQAGRTVVGIEAEIAFRFASEPPVGGGVAGARAAVEQMLVLIELCETRLAGWPAVHELWKLADFQSHGAFVLGSGTRDLHADFHTQRVEVTIDGRAGAKAVGSHPTGDLWSMLAWSVDHCAGRGMPLAAGDVVTTGSWVGLLPLAPGEEAVARFEGIGAARLALR